MIELIEYELSAQKNGSKIMCARGLLMLLHIDQLIDFQWLHISQEII